MKDTFRRTISEQLSGGASYMNTYPNFFFFFFVFCTPHFYFSSNNMTHKNAMFFCSAKQMTGFYMKRNTGLKWIKFYSYLIGAMCIFTNSYLQPVQTNVPFLFPLKTKPEVFRMNESIGVKWAKI